MIRCFCQVLRLLNEQSGEERAVHLYDEWLVFKKTFSWDCITVDKWVHLESNEEKAKLYTMNDIRSVFSYPFTLIEYIPIDSQKLI